MQSSTLQADPLDYSDVTHILVDPSCTGSGIFGRIDYNPKVYNHFNLYVHFVVIIQNTDKCRLRSLCAFQKRALKHAMSFPSVQRVVYSTCSLHFEVHVHTKLDIRM